MTMTTPQVTTTVLTKPMRKRKKMTRKQIMTNLGETLTRASKTWMNRQNRCPVRWKVWKKTKRRKHPND